MVRSVESGMEGFSAPFEFKFESRVLTMSSTKIGVSNSACSSEEGGGTVANGGEVAAKTFGFASHFSLAVGQ